MRTVTLLYVGMREDDSKYYDAWVDLTGHEDGNDGEEFKNKYPPRLFDHKSRLIEEARPGQIFSFDADDGDTFIVHLGTGKYLGMWLNVQDVTKWQVSHLANIRVVEMAEIIKKEGANRFDLEILRPFRDSYRALQPTQRHMLLAQMLEFVTQPKKKKKKRR